MSESEPGRFSSKGFLRRLPLLRSLSLGTGIVLGLGVVAIGAGMEVSSRPTFCGSCHIMQPYYQSWRHSSHHNIACVECHIPPGVTAELRKKYEALSMVARYFTGTYGTNPWTEIDDAACLRCHERRLLTGKELFGDVLFDHAAHLSGMRRGKTLRCTSCHSQIVQGSHIAVTASTCILCHFKGQESGTGTARCTLCHQIPQKVIRRANLTFDHGEVARFGMECTTCHARPPESDGAVPKERCVTCHNETARLAQYGDPELLHRKHVTEHKVDCLNCHLTIEHVGQPRLEAAAPSCATCHTQGHSPQMGLYAGVGGRGVPSQPNPMFLAGVRCEGCHLDIPGSKEPVHRAGEVSCMTCHGPSYRRIFRQWKEGMEAKTAAVGKELAETERALGDRRSSGGRARPAGGAGLPSDGGHPVPAVLHGAPTTPLEDARFNFDLVECAHGIHNVDYATSLLKRSHDDLNRARSDGGLAPLALPWSELPFESPCLSCHQGIENQQGKIFDRTFIHGPHLLRAKLECSNCHRTHQEKPKGEVVRYDAAGCEACHHAGASKEGGPAQCLTCHAAILKRTFKVPRGEFSHQFHLEDAGQTCADCHDLSPGKPITLKEATCQGCHG